MNVVAGSTIKMQPAPAKWYDRRDVVFVEFCVEDSRDVKVNFDKCKLDFSCVSGTDNVKHHNEVELFGEIDPKESKHKPITKTGNMIRMKICQGLTSSQR
ncbi:hypothetical protein WMY93_030329 [Mugilogobius chulae]|uniref:Prostaglandin E synthase 3 n=1 Tax=Mugilogobius chulae TaxID=88201 RepID=A0AAW0MPT0_9GOBI